MAPVRHLPTIQNWDCHQCGTCCSDYWVPISDEERERIEAQGWDREPDFQGEKLFVKYGPPWRRRYRLNQRDGDRCIFLSDDGLCRIHAKFGIDAKPFACRLYPYILVPVGDHWRVSLRFACPSAAANWGRSLEHAQPSLNQLAQELIKWDRARFAEATGNELLPPPPLTGGERVDWHDLQQFASAVSAILQDRKDPLPRRMLRCLAMGRLCQQARFTKIRRGRLREFLELLSAAVNAEVPRDWKSMDPPSWIGRVLFRSSLVIFLRKDQGARRGVSKKGRLALVRAISQMIRGSGPLPQLQLGLPRQAIEDFEVPLGSLSPETEAALERYYQVKVESLQFCGRTNFDLPFWEGFTTLALTLPMILWLARGYMDLGQLEAVHRSITVIDENFGYNPLLGRPRHRLAMRILMFRHELDRLIAWYGR